MKLQSFRDGVEFVVQKPDVDGYIEVIENLKGPKGVIFVLLTLNSLKRSFPDVTREEVGRMELEDMVEVVTPGLEGLEILKKLVTSKTLEV